MSSRLDGGILFYSGDKVYGWLSNYYRAWEVVDESSYPTNEHFYQSQKAKDAADRIWIMAAPKPFLAMKAGRSLRPFEVVPNWGSIKFAVMKRGLLAKFTQNLDLKEKLLATGSAALHENSPTDMVWGVKGLDMLGKLLCEVREEIQMTARHCALDVKQ
jgi:ribA/ribD-fused uncharacterized protein